MHKILRYISQNKIKIIGIIFFILFGYSIIRAANSAYERQGKNITYKTEAEMKAEEKVKLTNKDCQNTVEEFLKICTSGNYEKAYTYLSEECKKNSYPTLEDFTKNYCEKRDIKEKGYSIKKQNGAKHIYKIQFNDILNTGKEDTSKNIEYYRVVLDNGQDIRLTIE